MQSSRNTLQGSPSLSGKNGRTVSVVFFGLSGRAAEVFGRYNDRRKCL